MFERDNVPTADPVRAWLAMVAWEVALATAWAAALAVSPDGTVALTVQCLGFYRRGLLCLSELRFGATSSLDELINCVIPVRQINSRKDTRMLRRGRG